MIILIGKFCITLRLRIQPFTIATQKRSEILRNTSQNLYGCVANKMKLHYIKQKWVHVLKAESSVALFYSAG